MPNRRRFASGRTLSPLDLYEERISSEELTRDQFQLNVIAELVRLHNAVEKYTPDPTRNIVPGFISKVRNQNYNLLLFTTKCQTLTLSSLTLSRSF